MSRALQQSRFRSQTLRRIESKRRTAESASSNFGHHSAHYPHYKDGERAALTARAATYNKVPVPSPAVFGSGLNRFREARWPDAARNPPFLISMSEIRLDGGSHPARDGTPPHPRSTRSWAMPSRIHPISEPRPVQAALKDSDNDSLEFFAPSKCARGCGDTRPGGVRARKPPDLAPRDAKRARQVRPIRRRHQMAPA